MSEMKPVAWRYRTRDGSHCVTRHFDEVQFEGVEVWPLYTADQLAEAAAAERERCAEVCEGLASDYAQKSQQHPTSSRFMNGMSQSAQNCVEAIRSAAK